MTLGTVGEEETVTHTAGVSRTITGTAGVAGTIGKTETIEVLAVVVGVIEMKGTTEMLTKAVRETVHVALVAPTIMMSKPLDGATEMRMLFNHRVAHHQKYRLHLPRTESDLSRKLVDGVLKREQEQL